MAKIKTIYICNNCSYETSRWLGKCPNCNEWNTLDEKEIEQVSKKAVSTYVSSGTTINTYTLKSVDEKQEDRYTTGLNELDRVLGGGIVKGSLILLGGEPGAGKSTILLQISNYMSENMNVLYVSGEESVRQIKLRAKRLKIQSENLLLSSDNNVINICKTIKEIKPSLVIIDSIQTMNLEYLTSSTGSVTQVRECTNTIMKTAKSEEIPIFIVGHVNKEGAIAGPKILEHIVDTVLYFEGDKNMSYRILRSAKNRYGSTNEIGVFDMTYDGLVEITNPSEVFLMGKPLGVSGTSVVCVLEGTRPILAEVQALVAKTTFPVPRRTSTGFDYNRLNLLLAVIEKRCGYFLGSLDVYVNVVGGLKLTEPACDLPIALSIISSLTDTPISEDVVSFGEIGLTGEIRSVVSPIERILEAQRLGFKKCILPYNSFNKVKNNNYSIELLPVSNLKSVFKLLKL